MFLFFFILLILPLTVIKLTESPALQVGTVYPTQPRASSNSPPPADYKLPPGIVVGQTSMGRDDYTFAPRS